MGSNSTHQNRCKKAFQPHSISWRPADCWTEASGWEKDKGQGLGPVGREQVGTEAPGRPLQRGHMGKKQWGHVCRIFLLSLCWSAPEDTSVPAWHLLSSCASSSS